MEADSSEPYSIEVDKRIVKSVQKFPVKHLEQLKRKLKEFATNPRPHDCKQLQQPGGYRVTVGEYRILYTVNDGLRIVRVYRIVKRNDFSYRA